MVIIRADPRHMQHSRPTDTPPMTTQRVTFPPQAHVFPTFHRSTFTTTHHPKPLHWSRFLLTTTLTRRCIPTRTRPMHLNTPRVRHLRMRPEQTTLRVLPFGEAYVVNTGGLYSQRGLRHRLSYPRSMLGINFVSEQHQLFMRRARYILMLCPAPGRLRPLKPLRLFLVLHLMVTLFRRSPLRSFTPLTRLARIKVLRRPRPPPRGAQKIITRQLLSFKETHMEVERTADTSRRTYTTRIRCRIPRYCFILRALMRCFRFHNHNRGRLGHHYTRWPSIQGCPLWVPLCPIAHLIRAQVWITGAQK